MSEKRKNEARRGLGGFQWWLLVIGFALGMVVMIGVQASNQTGEISASAALPYDRPQLEMTVTALMVQAQATPAAGMDSLLMTATQIVREATMTAISANLTASP